MKKKAPVSSSRVVYARLMTYVYPHWRLFLVSFIGYIIYAATQPMFAMIIEHIIETFNTEAKTGLEYLPLLFIGLFFVRGIGSFLGSYFLSRVSGNLIHNLRCEIFNHYTRLPSQYFDTNNSGFLISRITYNVGEVTRATTDSTRIFVREGLTAIGLIAYLSYTNWQLSLVFLLVAPIVALMVSYVSKRLKRLSRNMQDTIGDLTHITSEMVNGNRIVKTFGGEDYERSRFLKSSAENRKQYMKLIMTLSIHNPLIQFVISLALAGLMYFAVLLMRDSGPGEFVAYLTAAFFLPKPIRQLSDANSEIQRGIAAAESLFEVLDEKTEIDHGSNEISLCKGKIEFKNLRFRYPDAEEDALKEINLCIEPGQTVALVGASGGGKSSLINLLPRFYEFQNGEILIDGIPINDLTLASLRSQIGLVTQHVTLFNASIEQNIAYGSLQPSTPKEILQAAEDAYAMEFIQKMPQGLQTEIGENGVRLSGGQRQRLALARALLKNSPILILDEATSALDTQSERNIQLALNRLMGTRTTLVVAHRLSTIENADVIVVMEKGRIVEQGSHQELLAKGTAYAKLHNMHFKTQDEESS